MDGYDSLWVQSSTFAQNTATDYGQDIFTRFGSLSKLFFYPWPPGALIDNANPEV